MITSKAVEISIVSTLYKSEKYISSFLSEVKSAMKDTGVEYELVLVLDGITDNSKQILMDRRMEFEKMRIIELSRNFGHHNALMAGMTNTEGAYVMIIDCDLEVRPSIIPLFYMEIKNRLCDVVYGYQSVRKGRCVERILGKVFWKIFNLLSDIKTQENIATERIMTRQYINELTALNDRNLFLAGLMNWVGFEQHGIEITKELRHGESTYTLVKRIQLMVNAITSFSAYPLSIMFASGMAVTAASILFALYYIAVRLFYPESVLGGFTSVITAIMFSTGVIVMALGIVGKYIEKIFNQVKSRPLYIIKKII